MENHSAVQAAIRCHVNPMALYIALLIEVVNDDHPCLALSCFYVDHGGIGNPGTIIGLSTGRKNLFA
jgi:hypothetical protein